MIMAASSHHHQQQEIKGGERASGRSKQWGSPERTMVWREPTSKKKVRVVGVVYYLCRRDGQLEHPHFMEVPSDGHGLRLRDFTERLDMVRGKGMSSLYSWSSKRSYKHNGFVWHDLTDQDDIIHPALAAAPNEYVLKGSQLLLLPVVSTPPPPQLPQQRDEETTTSSRSRKKWSSFDDVADQYKQHTELAIDEISPPPSSGSPDVVETNPQEKLAVGVIAGGRMRASSLLMHLVSCGITRRSSRRASAAAGGGIITQDRDYYSGSLLIHNSNKSNALPVLLNRSSSCNVHSTRGRRPVESNHNETEDRPVQGQSIIHVEGQ